MQNIIFEKKNKVESSSFETRPSESTTFHCLWYFHTLHCKWTIVSNERLDKITIEHTDIDIIIKLLFVNCSRRNTNKDP